MLQNIRNHVQGVVAVVVIALVAISFVFFGVSSYFFSSGSSQEVVAKVGSTKINRSQFSASLKHAQAMYGKIHPDALSDAQQLQLKKMVLNNMIQEAVLANSAGKNGFRVSFLQLRSVIAMNPIFQVDGRFSKERFNQILYVNKLTETQLLNNLSQNLQINQLKQGVDASAFLLPGELSADYKLLKQTRRIGYFMLSPKPLLNKINPSPLQINDYYNTHQKDFKSEEKISVNYVVLSPQVKSNSASKEELQRYYKDNVANYTVPAKWKLLMLSTPASAQTLDENKQAHAQIAKWQMAISQGASFSDLVEKSGENATPRWHIKPELPPAVLNALSTLGVQHISAPIRTNKALVLVKLLALEKAKVKAFVDVKEQIKQMLAQQSAQRVFANQSDQLTNLVYTNPDSLDLAAKKLHLTVQTSASFSRLGVPSGIFSNPRVVAAAFSRTVLQQNNSDPIALSNGRLVVLRIHQHQPSRERSLKEVTPKIIAILKQQQASTQIQQQANAIVKKLRNGQIPASLAKEYRLVWQTHDNVSLSDKALDPILSHLAFSVPSSKGENTYHAASEKLVDGDFVVLTVLDVHYPDFSKALAIQRKDIQSGVEDFLGQMDYRLYTEAMIKKARIKIYDKSLQDAVN